MRSLSTHALWSAIVVSLVLLVPAAGSLEAQLTTATISGLVQDSSGGIIPGVSVTVTNVETGVNRSAVSDDSGRYVVPLLDPGSYEVSAELTGFQTAVRSGIKLEVGARVTIDLTLSVGEISERVVVQGEAPLVETTSTTIAGLVDDKKIRDLPLNGRSFEQLALLQTGVTVFRYSLGGSNVGTGTKFSVAGSRPAHNNFMLDGIAINDSASQTPGSAAGNNLGVESIREFKVLTNTYSAAYGRNSGAIVNVVTKSGTNTWHGSVFEFHRNSALDAKNFFDNPNEDIPGFKRNQFGFTIGGPIVEDRTFIFGNYEGLRERLGLPNVGIVINQNSRNGLLPVFDANGQPTGEMRSVTVDSSVTPFFQFIPLPNGRDFGDGTGEFLSSPSKRTDEDYFSVRFDHHFSDNNSIFSRYTIDDGEVVSPDAIVLYNSTFQNRNQSLVLEDKMILSPTFINTVRVGFNRSFLTLQSLCASSCPETFIPGKDFGKFRFGQAQSGPAPITTVGTDNPEFAPYNTFQYADDVNLTRGKHSIQFGGNVSRIQNNAVILGTGENGQYIFNTIENFLTARPDRFQSDTPLTNRHRGWRQTHFGFYLQDDFNATPTVTLNLGLRWEFVTEIDEVADRSSQLVKLSDPEFTTGLPLFNFTGHQLQPRIGLAWDPFGTGKTVVRVGAGIFHDQMVAFYYNLAGSNLLPFSKSVNIFPFSSPGGRVPFPNAFDLVREDTTPTSLPLNPDNDVPMKVHYNLNVQQELASDTVLTLAYVGSRGMHLPRSADANSNVFQIRPDGSKFWPAGRLPRLNPNFVLALYTQNDVNSFYNSLQVALNKRFANNLQYQISYTWGHTIDDGSQQLGSEAQNSPQNHTDVDNRKADRGHSSFDVRNTFVSNVTFDLPFGKGHQIGGSATGLSSFLVSGWQLNAIVTLSDGVGVSPLVGFNNSNNGDLLNPERVSLKPNGDNNPVLGGPDQYFDPQQFVLPPAGTLGDVARNTIIGPGFANLDFSVTKNSQLSGGDTPVNVQFRAEFFNIFNRPNFGLPDPTLFQAGGVRRGRAGRISSTANTSRQVQFGVKIVF